MTTGVICTPPILQFTLNNGQLAAGGSILTQVGGFNAATYQDQPLTVPLPNPIPLNSRGEISNASGVSCQLFLTPNTVYVFTLFDGPNGTGNQIWSAAYVNGVQIVLTQAAIGLVFYPQTAAEISAGVTPSNYAYPELLSYRYGALGDNTHDDSGAIRQAISVAQAYATGATVDLGAGQFKCFSGLTISSNRIHLKGRGPGATRLNFAPTATGVLLTIANSGTITQGSVRDLTLWSDDSTFTKTALDVTDYSGYWFQNIVIGGSVAAGGASYWSGGAGSIGLRTRGRDTTGFMDVTIFADKPIQISINPHSSISIDQTNFHDTYLGANGFPCVTIDPGVTLTQVSFTGFQSWVTGTGGLFWVDGTSPGSSSGLDLQNVRYENGTVAANYFVQIDVTSPLTSLLIRGGQTGGTNGFHLRNITYTHIDSFMYTDGAHVALNADGTVSQLEITQCLWQTGSTAVIAGLQVVDQFPSIASGPLPSTGYLMPTGLYQQTITATRSGTVAALSASGLTTVGTGSQLGTVTITDDTDQVVAIFFLKGTNHATVLGPVSDAGFFSVTAGTANNINCYWNAGSSQYVIQNGYGVTKTVRYVMDGHT